MSANPNEKWRTSVYSWMFLGVSDVSSASSSPTSIFFLDHSNEYGLVDILQCNCVCLLAVQASKRNDSYVHFISNPWIYEIAISVMCYHYRNWQESDQQDRPNSDLANSRWILRKEEKEGGDRSYETLLRESISCQKFTGVKRERYRNFRENDRILKSVENFLHPRTSLNN